MAGYRKKIAYLDYLENGMKLRNAGFVRIEDINGQTRLELRVKNIPEMFSGQYELKTNAEGVAGRISISRGCGSCCLVWKNSAGALKGKRMEETDGVYIRLPGRRLLQAVWDTPIAICVEEEKREADAAMPQGAGVEACLEQEEQSGHEERSEQPEREARLLQGEQSGHEERPEQPVPEQECDALEMVDEPLEQEEERQKAAKEQACYGDKWEQLAHMYALIHPFGDDREYLSIAPRDFVVMRQEYQKMVHNSFLLHGYYNYKHLILGRVREKEGWSYYLGVPGNFYGREKMVAEMFGFEAFEGEKEPAKAGDFGYFMKRVEI